MTRQGRQTICKLEINNIQQTNYPGLPENIARAGKQYTNSNIQYTKKGALC